MMTSLLRTNSQIIIPKARVYSSVRQMDPVVIGKVALSCLSSKALSTEWSKHCVTYGCQPEIVQVEVCCTRMRGWVQLGIVYLYCAVCDSAACTLNCFVIRRCTLAFNLEQGQMLDWKMFWYLVLWLPCREWIEEVALLEGQLITQRLKGCGEKVLL